MRLLIRLALALTIVACAAGSSLLLYCRLLTRRADALVRDSSEFANRGAKPLAIANVQRQFGNQLTQAPGCVPSSCTYEVVLSNRPLAALHIAPYTELRSEFWVRDGYVRENMLDYLTTVDSHHNVVAHSAIHFDGEGCYFFIDPWGDRAPLDANGLADLAADCSSAEKQNILAFNTACLTRFRGCKTLADLLPTVWLRADDKIKCRVRNKEGMVHAPPSWTWLNK